MADSYRAIPTKSSLLLSQGWWHRVRLTFLCFVPSDKDTSLRNGLLVFFFLVLPLLVAAALAFAKRDRLKRGCRRLMSRCHS